MNLDKYDNMPLRGRMKNANEKDDGMLLNTCPCCKKKFKLKDIRNKGDLQKWNGATADCIHCGNILVIDKCKFKPFHKWLNKKNPSWPSDGKGTGYIEF